MECCAGAAVAAAGAAAAVDNKPALSGARCAASAGSDISPSGSFDLIGLPPPSSAALLCLSCGVWQASMGPWLEWRAVAGVADIYADSGAHSLGGTKASKYSSGGVVAVVAVVLALPLRLALALPLPLARKLVLALFSPLQPPRPCWPC